jgi:hypothetical protein
VTWTGWGSLAAGRTNVAINGIVFNNQLYAFAVGTDGRMYQSRLSSVGGSWTGWAEVGGAGVTNAAVSPAVINGQLYLFAKGTDQHMYFNTTTTGSNWGGWRELPAGGTTDAAMSANVFNNQLYVFAKGINDRAVYQFLASGFRSASTAAPLSTTAKPVNDQPAVSAGLVTGKLVASALSSAGGTASTGGATHTEASAAAPALPPTAGAPAANNGRLLDLLFATGRRPGRQACPRGRRAGRPGPGGPPEMTFSGGSRNRA